MLSSGLFPASIEVVKLTANLYRSLAWGPAVYPDPDTFNTGRFLDPYYRSYRETLTEVPMKRGHHDFALAKEVAEAELSIACTAIALALKMEKKWLCSGDKVPFNDYGFTSTLPATAKPFEMEFVVRLDKHTQLTLDEIQ